MTATAPLSYLIALRDYLKNREPDAWKWFADHRNNEKQAESLRFDLLTSTYRLDRDNESEKTTYESVESVCDRLGVSVPITLYQSQDTQESGAGIFILPEELHLVFRGNIRSKLDSKELEALFAHEIAHYLLEIRESNGEFGLSGELLQALFHDEHFGESYAASARLFRLYTELFCDRVALEIVGDLNAVVSMFVKVRTGLDVVSPQSYLKQAEEIFATESGRTFRTEGITHPEMFIRVRSLKLWAEKSSDETFETKIAAMIEGEPSFDFLDLLARDRLHGLTRRLIDAFLEPTELRSDLTLAHARLFFSDYTPPVPGNAAPTDDEQFPIADSSLRDYWCFLLLDFVAVDRDLEESPLRRAFEIAAKLKIEDRFLEIVQKELKLRKKDLDRITARRPQPR